MNDLNDRIDNRAPLSPVHDLEIGSCPVGHDCNLPPAKGLPDRESGTDCPISGACRELSNQPSSQLPAPSTRLFLVYSNRQLATQHEDGSNYNYPCIFFRLRKKTERTWSSYPRDTSGRLARPAADHTSQLCKTHAGVTRPNRILTVHGCLTLLTPVLTLTILIAFH